MLFLNQIDPIALQLGPLAVHWYGLMYLLGFAVAWYLGQRRVRAGRLPGVDANAFGDLLFYGLLGVMLGGRIGYILFYDLSTYIADPLQVFKIWEGGMSFHGGLLGVVAAAWWWSRRHGLHFFDVADFIAPLVPPGLGFGRLGNYINGELWGKYTGGDWVQDGDLYIPAGVYTYYVSVACMHCANPLCVEGCPTGAMYKREEDGIVLVDREHLRILSVYLNETVAEHRVETGA